MNQNIAYFPSSNNLDHRQSNNSQNSIPFQHAGSSVEFHPVSGGSGFHTSSNTGSFHTNSGTFVTTNNGQVQHSISQQQNANQQRITTAVPVTLSQALAAGQQPGTVHVQLLPQGGSPGSQQQQHIIIAAQPMQQTSQANDPDDRRMAAFMEYFVEQQPVCSQNMNAGMQYQNSNMITTKYAIKNKIGGVEKSEKDQIKRAKQAEAARQRYHRLTSEEKKALNLKRTLAQKRKRQREKELAELESILRQTNDIVDDPEVTEQLREKRMRARWAEAARTRYQRMSSEERRLHNTKRRQRQVSVKNDKGEPIKGDDDVARQRIKDQNAKKAECARLRYHRMSLEEKKMYNQRRTEAFRRRRMEEEALLAMPIGRINGEALDRAQQIVVRNAKRAEAARLRYQRMTPEQRKAYNQKRYTPKRKREQLSAGGMDCDTDSPKHIGKCEDDEFDALSSLERDVARRTQQAQQALLRQRQTYGTGTKRRGLWAPIWSSSSKPLFLRTNWGCYSGVILLDCSSSNSLNSRSMCSSRATRGNTHFNCNTLLEGWFQQRLQLHCWYGMSCASTSCVNKYHNPLHLAHPSQQVTTTSSQILTYSMPPSSTADMKSDDDMLNELAIAAGQEEAIVDEDVDIKDEEGGHRDDKEARRQRLAEMARLRYQNLTSEEKKAVNSRRMLLRKRKRQREREMEELEAILRRSNDIEEDVVFIGDIRDKRQRESRAKAARSRYQSMNSEERRNYNQKRRLRQMGGSGGTEGETDMPVDTVDIVKQQIAQQNARKAELARQRYHRMSVEERKTYNKRRTESLRRRRMEEEALLATPAGQIDAESLQKAQQIMIRNAMRAEKARQRYNANAKRKTPEERKRSRPAKNNVNNEQQGSVKNENEDGDILSAIERDVIRRTQEAKNVLEQRTVPQTVFIKRENMPHEVMMVNNNNPIQAQAYTPIQVQSGGPGEVKTTTKYVSYMQLPAGTTQTGFLLADGQFVALQPALHHQQEIHNYPIEQTQPAFDNNFHHISQGAVLRPANPQQQPIVIGQRVELIQNPPGSDPYHHPPNNIQNIHVVNYNHQPPAPHTTHVAQPLPPPPPQQQQQQYARPICKHRRASKKRYHEMSAEARHEFNAKRALALKMSRLKDEELCRLGDEIDMTNGECDESLRASIEAARIRRQKRAESARQKYQKMSPQAVAEEHNAMRDAQRRQRKRELEEGK
uniref:Uncharacterized protein n=1 Tax=Ditylenchus dipsaci TaxID=166011 RepID=A0A915DL56_9BILA